MKNILVIAALVLVTLYGIIITINYIDINTKKGEMYDQIPVTKDPNQSVASDSIKPYRYEIRIQNDYDNEMLERTVTIESAIAYVKQYERFHDDLYVYNMITGELVTHSRRIALNDNDNE